MEAWLGVLEEIGEEFMEVVGSVVKTAEPLPPPPPPSLPILDRSVVDLEISLAVNSKVCGTLGS